MHRDFRDFLIVSKLVREEKATAEIIGDGGGVLDMCQAEQRPIRNIHRHKRFRLC